MMVGKKRVLIINIKERKCSGGSLVAGSVGMRCGVLLLVFIVKSCMLYYYRFNRIDDANQVVENREVQARDLKRDSQDAQRILTRKIGLELEFLI
jgi:hypothetical protein